MTAIYNTLIEKAIKDWVETFTGMPCIAEQQKIAAPRPVGDFCSYHVGVPTKLGYDYMANQNSAPDTYIFTGPRVLSVSVAIYSDEAVLWASNLRNSLEMESIRTALKASGIYPQRIFGLADTSALLETGYERRATLDISFCVTEQTSDETGYIETVELEQE